MGINLLSYKYTYLQAFFLSILAIKQLLHFTPIVGYSNFYVLVSKVVVVLSIVIYINQLKRFKSKKHFSVKELVLIFLMIIFVYVFMVKYDIKVFVFSITYMWPIFLILTASKEVLLISVKYFKYLFVLSVIPSIVLYPFIAMGLHPMGEITPSLDIKEQLGWYYNNYLFSFQLIDYYAQKGAGLFRMSGLFDEAGVVGTFAAFLLIIERYEFKRANSILVIAGILSFSLAFYVMTMIYLLFTLKPATVIKIILPIILLLFIFQSNSFVQDRLLSRVSIENGSFSGDNRTTEVFDIAYGKFTESSQIWMGMEDASQYVMGAASWKNLIWEYGVVGTILMLSFFILYALFNVKGDVRYYWPFFIVFILNIYQRSHIFDPAYILVFAGGITYTYIYQLRLKSEAVNESFPKV